MNWREKIKSVVAVMRCQGVWNVVEKGHFRNRLTQDLNIAALHVVLLKSTPQLNKSVVAEKLL